MSHQNEFRVDEANEENNQEGASMVEYALLLLLIVVVAIVGVRSVGQTVSGTFSSIASSLK